MVRRPASMKTSVTPQEREQAIQQIVSRAVVSTEIVDILAASGLKSPDISIRSQAQCIAPRAPPPKPCLSEQAIKRPSWLFYASGYLLVWKSGV
ncbi:type I restriction enzyme endonuclease domain-containing protein [Methylococcus geothermalis]|uniref:type I restriction enzyme endonuclease domain-containing protein n=1 Tax=Methylococcus geothermalis TaxID=2681310 RepID=UPI002B40868D|nr:type I restriction enzyme endonuclease domain-containing protein [Methylococcus geothermalis]